MYNDKNFRTNNQFSYDDDTVSLADMGVTGFFDENIVTLKAAEGEHLWLKGSDGQVLTEITFDTSGGLVLVPLDEGTSVDTLIDKSVSRISFSGGLLKITNTAIAIKALGVQTFWGVNNHPRLKFLSASATLMAEPDNGTTIIVFGGRSVGTGDFTTPATFTQGVDAIGDVKDLGNVGQPNLLATDAAEISILGTTATDGIVKVEMNWETLP